MAVSLPEVQVIPEIRKDIMEIMIFGTRPLLCDKKPELVIGMQQPDIKSDDEAFRKAQYTFEKSGKQVFGFPAAGIKLSMVSACAHCSAVKAHTKGRVFVLPDDWNENYVELLSPNPPEKFNTVVAISPGKSVPATFARFEEWAIQFRVSYFPAMIPKGDVLMLLSIAGELVGIGARRVETGDNRVFGTFRIASTEDIETAQSWKS